MTYDPEKLEELLREQISDMGVQAEVDQRQAQLDHDRDCGTWWAALIQLSQERDSLAAAAVAGHNLKVALGAMEHHDLIVLSAYLLCNTISLVSKYEDGGDMAFTVSKIVGGESMLMFEKFAATGGSTCPECGIEGGWDSHACRLTGNDEPVEG